jgi:hypothetical protein
LLDGQGPTLAQPRREIAAVEILHHHVLERPRRF